MPVGYTGFEKRKMIKEVSRRNFNQEILNKPGVNIVQFKTEWNGACRIMQVIYEDLSMVYPGAGFFTVDFQKNPVLGSKYGVVELPTILFFNDGKLVDHAIGLMSRKEFIEKINNILK